MLPRKGILRVIHNW